MMNAATIEPMRDRRRSWDARTASRRWNRRPVTCWKRYRRTQYRPVTAR